MCLAAILNGSLGCWNGTRYDPPLRQRGAFLTDPHSVLFLFRNMHALGRWLQANRRQLLANLCQLTANGWRLPSILSDTHQQPRAGGCRPPLTSPLPVGGPFFNPLTSDVQSVSYVSPCDYEGTS